MPRRSLSGVSERCQDAFECVSCTALITVGHCLLVPRRRGAYGASGAVRRRAARRRCRGGDCRGGVRRRRRSRDRDRARARHRHGRPVPAGGRRARRRDRRRPRQRRGDRCCRGPGVRVHRPRRSARQRGSRPGRGRPPRRGGGRAVGPVLGGGRRPAAGPEHGARARHQTGPPPVEHRHPRHSRQGSRGHRPGPRPHAADRRAPRRVARCAADADGVALVTGRSARAGHPRQAAAGGDRVRPRRRRRHRPRARGGDLRDALRRSRPPRHEAPPAGADRAHRAASRHRRPGRALAHREGPPEGGRGVQRRGRDPGRGDERPRPPGRLAPVRFRYESGR
jgi:hypothetical protein